MKTMLIKSIATLGLLLPLGLHAATINKSYEVTDYSSSQPRIAYGYDAQVRGNFVDGGDISKNIKDPRWRYIDPLTVYMRTVWPEDVTTVRQAIDYLLEPTGYQLVTGYPAPREASSLVDQPIPPIAKVHRTMPVLDALQLLVGLNNYVVVDQTHHLVSFQHNG